MLDRPLGSRNAWCRFGWVRFAIFGAIDALMASHARGCIGHIPRAEKEGIEPMMFGKDCNPEKGRSHGGILELAA